MTFQIGAAHRLYLAYDTVTAPKTVGTLVNADGTNNVIAGTPDSINDLVTGGFLKLADQIKDVTVGGSNNTVDVTTRQTARQGFSAEIIATSSASTTVQFAYEPRETGSTWSRDDLAILQYCFVTKKTIYAIDLDGKIDDPGASGIGANWSIGFSTPKEVQGQVVMDVEFALESYAQIVYLDTTFKALVDP